MRLCLIIFYFVLLFPSLLKAQSNYKSGYVVTIEGDTIQGFIDYREWRYTPVSFSFREGSARGAEKILDVSNTRYLEITGLESYQRYEGPITMNPVAIDKVSSASATRTVNGIYFLKENYKNNLVNLLSYSDEIKTRFFFQENDGSQPQELFYHRYYQSEYSTTLITQKGYVGQLLYLAEKHKVVTARLVKEIESAQYRSYDLENIMSKINEMRVSQPAPPNRKPGSTRFYAGVALNISNVRISGRQGAFDDPDSNPTSLMPRFAAGFDAFLNKNTQQLYLRMEGALTASKYFVQNEVINRDSYSHYTYKIAHQSLSFSPQLIYNLYNKDNFKFHVGLAGQFNYSNYTDLKQTATHIYESTPGRNRTYESDDSKDFGSLWFAYAFRTGAVVNKRYEVYATYFPYAAANRTPTNPVEFSSLYLGLNYLFNKE